MNNSDVVGLVPAAGYARRISPLPCSKEIYPITQADGTSRVVSSYLLDSYRKANINKAYFILRTGKWDIPEYFKDGESVGLNLAYIVSEATGGVPQTLDKTYSYIKDNRVVFGFPDIIFQPSNAFNTLLEKLETTGADLVLGLFNATNPEKMDMVEFDDDGGLKDIIIKPERTSLTHTWIIAAWTPVFTNYLHEYLRGGTKRNSSESKSMNNKGELHIGDIFRDAINEGFKTDYVKFNGLYLDIGTPETLKKTNDIEWVKKFESDDLIFR